MKGSLALKLVALVALVAGIGITFGLSQASLCTCTTEDIDLMYSLCDSYCDNPDDGGCLEFKYSYVWYDADGLCHRVMVFECMFGRELRFPCGIADGGGGGGGGSPVFKKDIDFIDPWWPFP